MLFRSTWEDFLSTEKIIDIDHIIPMSAYDFISTDDPEFKKCWDLKNLRFCDSKYNQHIKGSKIIPDLIKRYKIKHLLPEGLEL